MTNNSEKVLLLVDGEEEFVDYNEFIKKYGVFCLIRIHADEFENIDRTKEYFAHFNMEKTTHKVGDKHLVIKILRHGTYATESQEEKPPLLSLEGSFIGESIKIENNIPYQSLTSDYFEYAMKGMQNSQDIADIIVKRYAKSRADLSRDQIIEKGVAFTLLKIRNL